MTTFDYGETVTLVKRTVVGRDAYQDDILGDAETVLPNVPAWPTSTTEDDQGASTVYDLVTVYLPPDIDIASYDAVRVYGGRYEVVGQPEPFVSPFSGFQPGLPVALRKVTG